MAKSRRARTKPAPAQAAPAPARTLLDFTHQGFDALLARMDASASGEDRDAARSRKAFGEAIERLKLDYARLLKGPG